MLTLSATGLLALLPALAWFFLWTQLKGQVRISWGGVILFLSGGLCAGAACWWLEERLWDITGLGLSPSRGGVTTAVAAMLFFAAPLEEGAKVVVLWPAYLRGLLRHPADGVLRAATVATGFAMMETLIQGQGDFSGLLALRLVLGQFAHVFFAAVWGFVLASRDKAHWLRFVWAAATLFHGLFDHIVFWRGVGTLAAVVPGLIAMVGFGWYGLFRLKQQASLSPALGGLVLQGPSLQALTDALRRRDRPLMLHWIVLGALVTTGVVLVAFALAVFLGHRLGIDFAAANEADMRSNGPLVLLGVGMMGAFPVAAYLIARASGTRSVLEPAMSAALAIFAAVVLLSMAAPLAVVFALAVAPVAFGLACVGAWFGLTK